MIIDYNINSGYAVLDGYLSLSFLGTYNTANIALAMNYNMAVNQFTSEIYFDNIFKGEYSITAQFTDEITLYG